MRYGWHGAEALMLMIEDELEHESWKDYTANMLCMIARPQYESEIPLYTDLAEKTKPENKMTADEIFDQVINKLDTLEMRGA